VKLGNWSSNWLAGNNVFKSKRNNFQARSLTKILNEEEHTVSKILWLTKSLVERGKNPVNIVSCNLRLNRIWIVTHRSYWHINHYVMKSSFWRITQEFVIEFVIENCLLKLLYYFLYVSHTVFSALLILLRDKFLRWHDLAYIERIFHS